MLKQLAMKKVLNMNPEEKKKMFDEISRPENRDKMEKAIEMAVKAGLVSRDQAEEVRKKFSN